MADHKDHDLNADPITGEPGSHPTGTAVGASAGGATGAAIGMGVGGPIGAAIGAVIGAVAGGLAGKGVSEAIDPTAEDAYWQQNHDKVVAETGKTRKFEEYHPAYRTGYEGYEKFEPGTKFEDAEPHLAEDYDRYHSTSTGSSVGAAGLTSTEVTATGTSGIGAGASAGGYNTDPASLGVSTAGISGGSSTASTSSTVGTTSTARDKVDWTEARHAAKAAWSRAEKGEATKMTLSEEEVAVRKQKVDAGAVRLRKVVHTETVNQPVELRREEVVVERVASGTPGSVPADAFEDGRTIEVPVSREEAVVEKTAHVTGEVNLRRTSDTHTEQVSETVRKEDVEVVREGTTRTTETDVTRTDDRR